jgi:hypothetical protein
MPTRDVIALTPRRRGRPRLVTPKGAMTVYTPPDLHDRLIRIARAQDIAARVRRARARVATTPVNRTGFFGGLIPREDGAHGTTQQVLPRAT